MLRFTRGRLFFLALSAALVVPLLSGTLLGAPAGEGDQGEDSFYKYLSVFTEVLRLVRQVYVEEPELHSLMAGALDGAADALDPFSTYVPAALVDDYLAARAIGRRHSGVLVLKERGVVYVVAVDEGSPGERAGLKRGDIVAKLERRTSRVMPLWQVRQLLAGKPGGRLVIEVIRRGTTHEIEIDLAVYEPPAVRLDEQQEVPVLRIPAFSSNTSQTVARLLSGLQADRLLLDLRGVAGGEAEAAYAVAERFVEGELGVLLRRDGPARRFTSSAAQPWQGRLGVLLNRGSQGPAEILAAVLKQRADARLLGEPTFGHAGSAGEVRLSSGGLLELTDGFYTGPDGEPLDESLSPDLEVAPESEDEEPDGTLRRAIELFLKNLAEPLEQVA